ncbi:4-alpha-glucanotransferase [Thalassococcus sp. BH17M4-6]|uniref:4-alpha-glucanotransferase n=1 Tax=Thalassococcus sp. BH17M4-6 TaxID=3413148 RepID=UPI003BE18709
MADPLSELAGRMGILPGFTDVTGQARQTPARTQRALLAAMGVDAGTEAACRDALAEMAARDGALPPWHVARVGRRPDIVLPDDAEWQITREDGRTHAGRGGPLPALPLGRHKLEAGAQVCWLLTAPARLPLPPRCWGLIAPLAGLRTQTEGGIGDYTDLGRMAQAASQYGAAFLGINPVHAGFPTDPAVFSPYTPSHRRRLSTLHIPVNYAGSHTPLIDYAHDIPARMAALETAFAAFEDSGRTAAFDAYLQAAGESLTRFATHQALSERHGAYWQNWPAALQDPESTETARAAADLAPRLRFHGWLQWRAETALQDAARAAADSGMALGLYLDLAVGTHPHGAETWEDRSSFAHGASLGAPPDAFALDGQNWQLAPFNPRALIETGFAPLAETLRRQLRSAGMLRIDHILGFERAYWVPDDPDAPGAYVQMPRDAMLAVARIEAARAGAVIVGEDLGNIPDGLQKALAASGVLGCRLTIFEQVGRKTPRFRSPGAYPKATIASFSTHDLPTWKGWREGREISARTDRGLLDAEFDTQAQEHRRAEVAALDRATGAFCDAAPDSAARMHTHLAQTGSQVVAVQIENILDMLDQPNLPGTVTEYPNWQQRLPQDIDTTKDDPRLEEAARIMSDNGR